MPTSRRHQSRFVPTTAGTAVSPSLPSERSGNLVAGHVVDRVLKVLTGLLDPAGRLVLDTFGLEPFVVGLVADPLLGLALELFGLVAGLVLETHRVPPRYHPCLSNA